MKRDNPWRKRIKQEGPGKDVFLDPSPPTSLLWTAQDADNLSREQLKEQIPAMQEFINAVGPGQAKFWEDQVKAYNSPWGKK